MASAKKIRELRLSHPDLPIRALAERFNVSQTNIWHVLHNHIWKE